MRRLMFGAYVLMAVWLLLGGARRIALQLAAGTGLDWAPFVSGGIGAVSLLLILHDDRRAHRSCVTTRRHATNSHVVRTVRQHSTRG